ncbi:MAG: hypothetical protein OEZ22_04085 [Spirochaetia bacterium]|nr:hypothetical protein [Spirochaetia bacterium]
MKKTKIIYHLLVLSLLNCFSTSNFKTGKVLGSNEDGSAQTVFVFGGYNQFLITPEIMYRSAIDPEQLDMGIKVFPIGIEIDAKYQVLDKYNFSGAGDFGVTYTSYQSGDAQMKLFTLTPTLLLTYNFTSWFSTTMAPKLMYTMHTKNTEGSDVKIGDGFSYGVSLTLDIGKWFGVMPEVGLFSTEGITYMTYGAMIRFGGSQ